MSGGTQALWSEAVLHRNVAGLPFDLVRKPAQAEQTVNSIAAALSKSGLDVGFSLLQIRNLSYNRLEALRESGLISRETQDHAGVTAVLLNQDAGKVIRMMGENHISIHVIRPGNDIASALSDCLALEDGLAAQLRFAWDERLGYLTAQPNLAGTGLVCSSALHLPFVCERGQKDRAVKIATDRGLLLRPLHSAGACTFILSTTKTLGVTEQGQAEQIRQGSEALINLEMDQAARVLQEQRLSLEDKVSRSLGTVISARLLEAEEMESLWSGLRMGLIHGLLSARIDEDGLERVMVECRDAHLRAFTGEPLQDQTLLQARAERFRELIGYGSRRL